MSSFIWKIFLHGWLPLFWSSPVLFNTRGFFSPLIPMEYVYFAENIFMFVGISYVTGYHLVGLAHNLKDLLYFTGVFLSGRDFNTTIDVYGLRSDPLYGLPYIF